MDAGVKSTALLFGGGTKHVLSGFSGAMLGLLSITGAPLYPTQRNLGLGRGT